MKYYLQLIGEDVAKVPGADSDFSELPNGIATIDGDSGLKLISFEKEDMDKADEAQEFQRAQRHLETSGWHTQSSRSVSVDVKPFGMGMGVSFLREPAWPDRSPGRRQEACRCGGDRQAFRRRRPPKKGIYARALQERISQANTAGYEIKQIDRQMVAQQVRIQMANQEITNQQKQIDHAQEIEEFLKNKYTGDELYSWMRGSLKTLYPPEL